MSYHNTTYIQTQKTTPNYQTKTFPNNRLKDQHLTQSVKTRFACISVTRNNNQQNSKLYKNRKNKNPKQIAKWLTISDELHLECLLLSLWVHLRVCFVLIWSVFMISNSSSFQMWFTYDYLYMSKNKTNNK